MNRGAPAQARLWVQWKPLTMALVDSAGEEAQKCWYSGSATEVVEAGLLVEWSCSEGVSLLEK